MTWTDEEAFDETIAFTSIRQIATHPTPTRPCMYTPQAEYQLSTRTPNIFHSHINQVNSGAAQHGLVRVNRCRLDPLQIILAVSMSVTSLLPIPYHCKSDALSVRPASDHPP